MIMAVRRVPKDPSKPLIGYEVRWRDPDGVQRKKLFKGQQKRQAESFFASTKTSLDQGKYIDVNAKTTVTQFAKQWVAIQPYRPASRERRESQIRTHLEGSKLGRMRLVAVKPSDVQGFATEKDRELASETVKNLMGFIGAVFNAAVRDRLIAYSPAAHVVLQPAEIVEVVPLTAPQVKRIVKAMPDRMKALVTVQAALGLRVGELLALRVEDIDFLRREVRIAEQIHPRTRKRMPLKTVYSRRVLPLPQTAADALTTHLASLPANDDGYVFTNELGHAYQAHTYQYRLKTQAKAIGLGVITPHDLRHAYASWLLLAGESVITVARRLGHKDASKVISCYGHLVPGTEDRTRAAIDRLFASTADTDQTHSLDNDEPRCA